LSVPHGRSRKARLNPELGFPTWCLVELLSQPRRALPCAGRRRFSPASAENTLQLSLLLNLPGTKGSVPDPARSCREKLPLQALSVALLSLPRSLPPCLGKMAV
ncbi:UNVERIFIED_CONTAM: hypothetical protein FQV15_0007645, partial [Eudyptes pachyrhynchus]